MVNRREFCLALSAAVSLAWRRGPQDTFDGFVAKEYRNAQREVMPYRLFVPEGYRKENSYPLVLWLHGGAGRGRDNLKHITGGNLAGSHVWTKAVNQSRHPCFVVAPQCAENELWATMEKSLPTRQLLLALELLDSLQRSFSLDGRRIYVAGQSMGGFGAWGLVAAHPKRFAASVPVCGGGDEAEAHKLVRVPIWAFHGELDAAVNAERSRSMIAAIRRAGGTPRYTEYKGAGHQVWDRAFNEPELLDWVFAQRA